MGAIRTRLKNRPVDWVGLSEEQAKAQWPILARWVGEVLVPWHELTRDDLPDCWAVHRPVVVELSWLRSTYVQAYHPRSPTHLAGEWQVRWRPAALARIKELTKECQPGEHRPRHGQPLTFAARPEAWRAPRPAGHPQPAGPPAVLVAVLPPRVPRRPGPPQRPRRRRRPGLVTGTPGGG